MKFIADVNITNLVIRYLRKKGHDVTDIKKSNPKASDLEIISIANNENRIILTHDKDFLTWTKFPKYQVGTILIRLMEQNPQHHLKKIKQLLKDKREEELMKSLTVITEGFIDSYPFNKIVS